jgi:hypothetical protein
MPRFLEDKLKKEYPNNPGAVYGTMNRLGYMHGNKETAAGAAAQAKHDRDSRKPDFASKRKPKGVSLKFK